MSSDTQYSPEERALAEASDNTEYTTNENFVRMDEAVCNMIAASQKGRERIAELEAEAARLREERDELAAEMLEIAGRCERWTTPSHDLGMQFANGRMGAFRDCASWIRAAYAERQQRRIAEGGRDGQV